MSEVLEVLEVEKKQIPININLGSFCLKDVFAHGDSQTTNIAMRSADFFDTFLKVSSRRCLSRPMHVVPHDFSKQQFDRLISKVEKYYQEPAIWNKRTPIRFAGSLLTEQKLGEEGDLLTEAGSINIFVCRGAGNKLYIVQLYYGKVFESYGWTVKCYILSKNMPKITQERIRLFIACRK